MAEKDITEKILMSHADVFADCINTLVYGGRQRLGVQNTQPAPTESFYKGKKQHNQFCDAGRYLMEDRAIIAQYIIENETRLKERQVIRKMSYQGGAYRQQLESKVKVYPVICIVLAWSGKKSRIPLSLRQLLKKNGAHQEELEQVDDAKLMVYHMNHLSPEIRKRFTSDMGFVADYLNEGNFDSRRNQRIVHLEALCDMMQAITGDERFTELAENTIKRQRKGEKIMMCEYIDELLAKGEARGIMIGEERGVKIGEERGVKIGEERGVRIGEERGVKIGETKLSSLLEKLYALGRDEEAKQAVLDSAARVRLYKEFRIADS